MARCADPRVGERSDWVFFPPFTPSFNWSRPVRPRQCCPERTPAAVNEDHEEGKPEPGIYVSSETSSEDDSARYGTQWAYPLVQPCQANIEMDQTT